MPSPLGLLTVCKELAAKGVLSCGCRNGCSKWVWCLCITDLSAYESIRTFNHDIRNISHIPNDQICLAQIINGGKRSKAALGESSKACANVCNVADFK